ncbi:SWI/SNF-related matrix-associated actin-dependent regulator of chromatin subfamily A containing DEAD/H box 1A isoform 1-T1 [Synchiropus picturatus]
MSLFNLDRFRFDKKPGASSKTEDSGSKSPESEKENKPAHMKTTKSSSKSLGRGVVFDDFVIGSSDEDEPKPKVASSLKSITKTKKAGNEDSEVNEKMARLQEIFPQLTRSQLLEVIQSTSTFEGAVAVCMTQFSSKEADGGRKRKQDESSGSQKSSEQPSKRKKPSEISEDDGSDGDEPNWEKQESMVRRLQKKFPDQDKEELRQVLKEHDWNVDDALQVLRMFSDPDESSMSASETVGKKSTGGRKKTNENSGESVVISDSDECVTGDSEDDNGSEAGGDDKPVFYRDCSTLSEWVSKSPTPALITIPTQKGKTSSSQRPAKSSATAQLVIGTRAAKQRAVERKQKARATDEHISSEGEDDEDDTVSSEFEDSNDELDAVAGMSVKKTEVFSFFQNATLDELCLIARCSVKKAQKIVELRPFDDFDSLVEVFNKQNGLTADLLYECKVFLKERNVVLGLMSKCEKISSLMVQQVTAVVEKGTGAMKQPKVLNSQFQLKPYQLIGLKWLLLLHEHQLSGILADEMGLGKTIQAIAFLAQLYQSGSGGPHLIIVPASTLDNWVRELKMWCPSLKVIIYYGTMEERRYLKHDILNNDIEFNVIVTTYNLAIGNDSDRGLFRKLRLTYAVFDEGHMLKNMNSLRYRHLMAINAKYRLLLTGTPLQNNILELMSLLNFIMPSMFSSSTTQLSKMFSTKAQTDQSPFERGRISQAKLIMKPFILRRVKSEVLKQLPAKEERVDFCSMSKDQQVLYENLFKKMKASSTDEKRELCNVMMQLRKMANHPLLHRQYYTTEKLRAMSKLMLKEPTHFDAEASLIQEDMEVMSDFELHRLCQQYSSISSFQLENKLLLDSGKFNHLTGLLASIKEEGSRVVLFSQFTMMLDIVEIFLKHLKHRYIRLDGSTPIADRIMLIDEFNTDQDIFVFLLSTRAGGLGINLTSANVVILHDIDCNPYNDKQAEDRCHRVGQTKTVQVIKLISKDTIEDAMLQVGQRKLRLEQDMTSADQGEEGTIPEDMASLLKALLGL